MFGQLVNCVLVWELTLPRDDFLNYDHLAFAFWRTLNLSNFLGWNLHVTRGLEWAFASGRFIALRIRLF